MSSTAAGSPASRRSTEPSEYRSNPAPTRMSPQQETSNSASCCLHPSPCCTACGTSPNRSTRSPPQPPPAASARYRAIHRLAILPVPQRLGVEVVPDMPRQRIRHHQRRTHQIIRPHLRRDSSLKVPVPRQHRHRHQPIVFNRLRNIASAAAPSSRCTSYIHTPPPETAAYPDTASAPT